MSKEDIERFTARSRQERAAAARAADTEAARRHAELADRYDAVARAYAALDRPATGQG